MSNIARIWLLLFSFVPLRSLGQKQSSARDIICWQEGRKLRWEDFQATTEPELQGEDKLILLGATTDANATIYDRTDDTGAFIKTFVRTEFNKRKSWANQDNIFEADRPAMLRHEQLHFDLVELTARRLRQLLARCQAQ